MAKTKNFFSESYKDSLAYIKESRKYIYVIIGLFFFFSLLGFVLPVPANVETKIMDFIEQLISQTSGMSQWELTKFIFLNNLKSSFLGMILGILFGIFPVITALSNGYLLGFVAAKTVQAENVLVLWRLFPHGIFELPALFISLGIGLKLGTFILKKNKLAALNIYLARSMRVFFFIVIPLLIIAAVIEGALIAISG